VHPDPKAGGGIFACLAGEGGQVLPLDLRVKREETFGEGYRIDPATGEIIVPDLEAPAPGEVPGSQDHMDGTAGEEGTA